MLNLRFGTIIIPILLAGGIGIGFFREVLIAFHYGLSAELDIFRVAIALPTLMSFSVGTSIVSSITPWLIKTPYPSPEYNHLVRYLLRLNSIFVVLLVVFGWFTAEWQAKLFAPGFDQALSEQLVQQIRWCWMLFLFVGQTFVVRALLNVSRIYWPGASVSLVRAASFIALLIAVDQFGFSLGSEQLLTKLTIAGGVSAFCIHFIPRSIRSLLFHIVKNQNESISANAEKNNRAEINLSILALLVYQSLNISTIFIDRAYASSMGGGVVAAFDYSLAIVIAFGTIFATGFNTVFLPYITRLQLSAKNYKKYSTALFVAIVVSGVALLVSTLLYSYSFEIISMIFARGKFGAQAVELMWPLLKGQAYGLLFMVLNSILVTILISRNRLTGLIIITIIKIVIRLLIVDGLISGMGLFGLGLAFTLTEMMGTLFLSLIVLRLYFKPKGPVSG